MGDCIGAVFRVVTLWAYCAAVPMVKLVTAVVAVAGADIMPAVPLVTEMMVVLAGMLPTEAVMVRYPREGHGIRESGHVVDSIDRSIRWYEKHFPAPKS